MVLLLVLQEKRLKEFYPNRWVALIITVTIPVTVAAAERSLSKLKMIKTYLRSTMTHEHLNGLELISIDCDLSWQIPFNYIVDDFAAKKSRF